MLRAPARVRPFCSVECSGTRSARPFPTGAVPCTRPLAVQRVRAALAPVHKLSHGRIEAIACFCCCGASALPLRRASSTVSQEAKRETRGIPCSKMMRPKNSKCLFVANLDDRVDRAMLYELGTQAGKVVHVASTAKGYGFIEYETEDSCEYALKLFSGTVRLFGRAVRFDYGNRRER